MPSLPPIVIDTCVFRDPGFIEWLKTYHNKKVISSVTYMEMQTFWIGKKNKDFRFFDRLLRLAGIEIQCYNKEQALATAEHRIRSNFNVKDMRDAMIASHASIAPWIVVTFNVKDFSFLGDRVLDPYKFKHLYASKA